VFAHSANLNVLRLEFKFDLIKKMYLTNVRLYFLELNQIVVKV